jgi:PTH2 family peptidyl-tRNA hydrolase
MPIKQVIVVRTDLNMRKGKIAAQSAHASMKVLLDRSTVRDGVLTLPLEGPMATWVTGRFTKIVLGVASEEDLVRAYEEAVARGIPAALVTDAGATEFHGVPTRTAAALGPDEADKIDVVTGPGGLVATKLL